MLTFQTVNPIYNKKIEVQHLSIIFKTHLERILGWKDPFITSSYVRATASLPELESKKMIAVEYHNVDGSMPLVRISEKGVVGGHDFKIGHYTDFQVAYLTGRDYVGDELTLFAAVKSDGFEKFDAAVKDLKKRLAQSENEGKLTIYTVDHGQARTYTVPLVPVSEDSMICDQVIMKDIKTDLSTFFNGDELFKHFEIAHRRGILMHGPPGCGKTMMCKHIATIAKVPVVQFFASAGCDTGDLMRFFEYMADISPAIVILEDLDSLFKGDLSRSNFLNIVDGACTDKNLSLLILATTNHVKDIDEALTQRPSRFDRHYHFDYPNTALRREYIIKRFARLKSLVDDEKLIEVMVNETEKMSFAHLNEIYTQACLKAIANKQRDLKLSYIREAADNVKRETTSKKTTVGLAPLADFDKNKGKYISGNDD
jgi:SpoVK/Ycf46/Vps4 family AAA+-type ATPase